MKPFIKFYLFILDSFETDFSNSYYVNDCSLVVDVDAVLITIAYWWVMLT